MEELCSHMHAFWEPRKRVKGRWQITLFPWSPPPREPIETGAALQTHSTSCTDFPALQCQPIFCITSSLEWLQLFWAACVLSHVSSWSSRPKLQACPTALRRCSRWGVWLLSWLKITMLSAWQTQILLSESWYVFKACMKETFKEQLCWKYGDYSEKTLKISVTLYNKVH